MVLVVSSLCGLLATNGLYADLPVETSDVRVDQRRHWVLSQSLIRDDETGDVLATYGRNAQPFTGPPEAAARAFLASQREFLNCAPEDLRLIRELTSPGGVHLTFEAVVGDLPVYPGDVVVTFDRNRHYAFLHHSLQPIALPPSTTFLLDSVQSTRIALDYLKGEPILSGTPVARAVWWAGDDRPRPAWRIRVPCENPLGDWELLVDAVSGEVFRVRNHEKRLDGSGYVYLPDPITTAQTSYGTPGFSDNNDANSAQLQAQRIPVYLRDITYSGGLYRLQGPWVTLADFESPAGAPATATTPGGFAFTRDQQGFEDVMCYYHIDASQRWIQLLGFDNVVHFSIVCDPHGLNGSDASHYIPSTNRIALGEGGVDNAEDADCILHEYGHAIQDDQVPNWGGGETSALGEGFGDYWAGSYSVSLSDYNQFWVYNWDGHNPFWAGRTLNANLHYPEDINQEAHIAGQIWSQALFAARNRTNVGREVMDRIVLQHHFLLGFGATMPSSAAAILAADNLLYGGLHTPDILNAFVPRGLLTGFASLACVEPNGGESWLAGTTHSIAWTYYGFTGTVEIHVNRDYPAGGWELIANAVQVSAESYLWQVSSPATARARIRVRSAEDSTVFDITDADFSIAAAPALTLLSPDSGDVWVLGDTVNVLWLSEHLNGSVRLQLNRNYPSGAWETLGDSVPNLGSFSWVAAGAETQAARIGIVSLSLPSVGDTSNADFEIAARRLWLDDPDSAVLIVGDPDTLRWASAHLTEALRIEFNRDYPGGAWELIADSVPDSGSWVWTVTPPVTNAGRFRITGTLHPEAGDTTDFDMTLAERSLELSSPTGGEEWLRDDEAVIRWSSAYLYEDVLVALNREYPEGAWETLGRVPGAQCTLVWRISGSETERARVRAAGTVHPEVNDKSDSNFVIGARTLTLQTPTGGETFLVGDPVLLTWQARYMHEDLSVTLNRDYPSGGWEHVVTLDSSANQYVWIASGEESVHARFRIAGRAHPEVGDTTAADCAIRRASLTITNPNGGEGWYIGDSKSITWTSQNMNELLRIELCRNFPNEAWELIVDSTLNDGFHLWGISGPPTDSARLRIAGTTHWQIGDTTDDNFAIHQRSISVLSPNGGETWFTGEYRLISWETQYTPGYVRIDLNRDYPAGGWTQLVRTPNAGLYPWFVTGSTTERARLRIISESFPSVGDTSAADFQIVIPNQPPMIQHDPLHDQRPDSFEVVAAVTDDAPGVGAWLYYRAGPVGTFVATEMLPTGNSDEYATTLLLEPGTCDYYIVAVDADSSSETTPTYNFQVGDTCGTLMQDNDGTAELAHWDPNTGFRWAVCFEIGPDPFGLCGVRVGISADIPDTVHTPIFMEILTADGPAGSPGSTLYSRRAGSIGNVIGGLPGGETHWTYVSLRDGFGNPMVVEESFCVAVSNPFIGEYEAFLHDTSSVATGSSFVYDPLSQAWYPDDGSLPFTHSGNRLIQVYGIRLQSPVVTIVWDGSAARLHWFHTGAPYYRIYVSESASDPYGFYEATTSDTTYLDINSPEKSLRFYTIYSSVEP